MGSVSVGRAYGPHEWRPDDAVLVDRLWPRGVARDRAPFATWLKEASPSTELRTWYGHDPARFAEFGRRYRAELAADPAAEAVDELRARAARGDLVLVTATKELGRSHVVVLRDVVTEGAGRRSGRR